MCHFPFRFPNLGLSGGCRGPGGAEPAGRGAADLATGRPDRGCQHGLLHAPGGGVHAAALRPLLQQAGPDTG